MNRQLNVYFDDDLYEDSSDTEYHQCNQCGYQRLGHIDPSSRIFYCNSCWTSFYNQPQQPQQPQQQSTKKKVRRGKKNKKKKLKKLNKNNEMDNKLSLKDGHANNEKKPKQNKRNQSDGICDNSKGKNGGIRNLGENSSMKSKIKAKDALNQQTKIERLTKEKQELHQQLNDEIEKLKNEIKSQKQQNKKEFDNHQFDLNQTVAQYELQISQLELENIELKSKSNKKEMEKYKINTAKLNEQEREKNNKYLKTNKENKQLKREKIGLENEINKLNQKKQKYAKQIEELKINNNKQMVILRKQNEEIQSKFNMIKKEKNKALEDLNQFTRKYQLEMKRNKTDIIQLKYKQQQKEEHLVQQIQGLQQQNDELILNAQNKDKLAEELKFKIDELKDEQKAFLQKIQELQQQNSVLSQQKQKSNTNNNIKNQYDDLLKDNVDCTETTNLLNDNIKALEEQVRNWRNQSLQRQDQMSKIRKEKTNIIQQKQALQNELKQCQIEFEQYKKKRENRDIKAVFAPYDIDDSNDNDEKQGNHDNDQPSGDELCKYLQEDLENYGATQKKRKKYPLKELKSFHDNKAQIIRNWDNSLYKNNYHSLWEELVEELEDKYEDNDDIDVEKMVYNILFDVLIKSCDVLRREYHKMREKEYVNGDVIVIDMVWKNIDTFYELLQKQKLIKPLANIYKYIGDKIEEIYKEIKKKHMNDMDDDHKQKLNQFVVDCCAIIWNVLYYDYTVYPKHFLLNKSDTKYNNKIHGKCGGNEGDNIEYCVFPAIMKENNYETKIWVICNDIE